MVGASHGGRLGEGARELSTDGAHAAEFFSFADGRAHYLAVANLGDRQANSYGRDSLVYSCDPEAQPTLTEGQRLPTLGATDFKAFMVGGAVPNEQDVTLRGDVRSTTWALTEQGMGH